MIVGAFSVIWKPIVKPMEHSTALVGNLWRPRDQVGTGGGGWQISAGAVATQPHSSTFILYERVQSLNKEVQQLLAVSWAQVVWWSALPPVTPVVTRGYLQFLIQTLLLLRPGPS